MSERLRIALAGDPGSGKSLGADHLRTAKGFTVFPNSTYISALALEYGLALRQRADYASFQRRLRLERSKSFVADAALAMPDEQVVNVGIRNRYDVDRWQEAGGLIVALECPIETRFARAGGTSEKYPDTLEAFFAAESPEYEDPDPYGQHTHYAMRQADYRIDTSGSPADMYAGLDAIVRHILALFDVGTRVGVEPHLG